jgi:outer membrane protein OmpA-like peptidoglycan-associated protein
MLLGAERGLMVRHALMSRGVEGRRIEVTSFGSTPCLERDGGNNRCVEVSVIPTTK